MGADTLPENMVFGLDIGTRSIVGTVGYKADESTFTVVAQHTRFHDTRAIIDGQVHDIEKVAETIAEVKRELETQLGKKLTDVCIAAAGRVLKTVQVRIDYELEEDTVITQEHIRTLIAGGIEKAYGVIREDQTNANLVFNCVGHTVVHYYLNSYLMTTLEGHKGHAISADLLATFLPQEVVDGLYSAVEKAGLQVADMTLEPIAAINVAIPEQYRLLNIALVDVGAGTSDISITKDGSIIAYGMIPCAGDAITECIMKAHLVDFATAETIKLNSVKRKEVSFKDIMKMKVKVASEQIREETLPTVERMTKMIADRIIELNGGKSVSAVFVVGGGGKFTTFIPSLAKHLNLPAERVALRGEEVLGSVQFLQEKVKKDSTLVTPIGICLNYYEQKNNIIFVYVNGERIKMYDNSKLTVVDAALKFGYPHEKLFPKRGKALTYTLNGERRMIRGEAGEAAMILLNGKPASINMPIVQHDKIQIVESTSGSDAKLLLSDVKEIKNGEISFTVNGKKIVCPRLITVNGVAVGSDYEVQDQDEIIQKDYYTTNELLAFMDLADVGEVLVNRAYANADDPIYENFTVEIILKQDFQSEMSGTQDLISDEDIVTEQEAISEQAEAPVITKPAEGKEMLVMVNSTPVILRGKAEYKVVDILDVYPFDLTVVGGREVILTKNGLNTDFTQPINENDEIMLYWEK